MSIFNQFDQLWKMFIRPPRQTYNQFDLGPPVIQNEILKAKRHDFEIVNKQGNKVKVSFYEPIQNPFESQSKKNKQQQQNQHEKQQNQNQNKVKVPCIMYLHCFNGSRVESIKFAENVLSKCIAFCCFDFAGSGNSEGEYVSLGYYEQDDTECVIKHIKENYNVSEVGLWGRSMGAVTSLLYSQRDPSLAAIALDSPFQNMEKLAQEIAKKKSGLPSIILKAVLSLIKSQITKNGNFNLEDIDVLKNIDNSLVPCLFIVSKEDHLIDPEHTFNIYNKYKGPKRIKNVIGDHNEARKLDDIQQVVEFLSSHFTTLKQFQNQIKINYQGYFKNSKRKSLVQQQSPQDKVSKLQEALPQNFDKQMQNITHFFQSNHGQINLQDGNQNDKQNQEQKQQQQLLPNYGGTSIQQQQQKQKQHQPHVQNSKPNQPQNYQKKDNQNSLNQRQLLQSFKSNGSIDRSQVEIPEEFPIYLEEKVGQNTLNLQKKMIQSVNNNCVKDSFIFYADFNKQKEFQKKQQENDDNNQQNNQYQKQINYNNINPINANNSNKQQMTENTESEMTKSSFLNSHQIHNNLKNNNLRALSPKFVKPIDQKYLQTTKTQQNQPNIYSDQLQKINDQQRKQVASLNKKIETIHQRPVNIEQKTKSPRFQQKPQNVFQNINSQRVHSTSQQPPQIAQVSTNNMDFGLQQKNFMNTYDNACITSNAEKQQQRSERVNKFNYIIDKKPEDISDSNDNSLSQKNFIQQPVQRIQEEKQSNHQRANTFDWVEAQQLFKQKKQNSLQTGPHTQTQIQQPSQFFQQQNNAELNQIQVQNIINNNMIKNNNQKHNLQQNTSSQNINNVQKLQQPLKQYNNINNIQEKEIELPKAYNNINKNSINASAQPMLFNNKLNLQNQQLQQLQNSQQNTPRTPNRATINKEELQQLLAQKQQEKYQQQQQQLQQNIQQQQQQQQQVQFQQQQQINLPHSQSRRTSEERNQQGIIFSHKKGSEMKEKINSERVQNTPKSNFAQKYDNLNQEQEKQQITLQDQYTTINTRASGMSYNQKDMLVDFESEDTNNTNNTSNNYTNTQKNLSNQDSTQQKNYQDQKNQPNNIDQLKQYLPRKATWDNSQKKLSNNQKESQFQKKNEYIHKMSPIPQQVYTSHINPQIKKNVQEFNDNLNQYNDHFIQNIQQDAQNRQDDSFSHLENQDHQDNNASERLRSMTYDEPNYQNNLNNNQQNLEFQKVMSSYDKQAFDKFLKEDMKNQDQTNNIYEIQNQPYINFQNQHSHSFNYPDQRQVLQENQRINQQVYNSGHSNQLSPIQSQGNQEYDIAASSHKKAFNAHQYIMKQKQNNSKINYEKKTSNKDTEQQNQGMVMNKANSQDYLHQFNKQFNKNQNLSPYKNLMLRKNEQGEQYGSNQNKELYQNSENSHHSPSYNNYSNFNNLNKFNQQQQHQQQQQQYMQKQKLLQQHHSQSEDSSNQIELPQSSSSNKKWQIQEQNQNYNLQLEEFERKIQLDYQQERQNQHIKLQQQTQSFQNDIDGYNFNNQQQFFTTNEMESAQIQQKQQSNNSSSNSIGNQNLQFQQSPIKLQQNHKNSFNSNSNSSGSLNSINNYNSINLKKINNNDYNQNNQYQVNQLNVAPSLTQTLSDQDASNKLKKSTFNYQATMEKFAFKKIPSKVKTVQITLPVNNKKI